MQLLIPSKCLLCSYTYSAGPGKSEVTCSTAEVPSCVLCAAQCGRKILYLEVLTAAQRKLFLPYVLVLTFLPNFNSNIPYLRVPTWNRTALSLGAVARTERPTQRGQVGKHKASNTCTVPVTGMTDVCRFDFPCFMFHLLTWPQHPPAIFGCSKWSNPS